MDMYKVIWRTWLTCCMVNAGGCILIAMVTFFNSRRLSRPTLMSLNVVMVSSMTVFLNGFILVGIQNVFLCKLCRVVIQYLAMALPWTVLALNIYCFIWTRYQNIDVRRVTPHMLVAFAVSPHIVSILVNTTLLAFSFLKLITTDLTCDWTPAHLFLKLGMICINTFIPCIINTFIVFTLILHCVSLYEKSNQREGAMHNAMLRRVQIVLGVVMLNQLKFVLIQPAMAEPVIHTDNLFYLMYLSGHTLTTLWWLTLLPDARACLLAGLKITFKAVFNRKRVDLTDSTNTDHGVVQLEVLSTGVQQTSVQPRDVRLLDAARTAARGEDRGVPPPGETPTGRGQKQDCIHQDLA